MPSFTQYSDSELKSIASRDVDPVNRRLAEEELDRRRRGAATSTASSGVAAAAGSFMADVVEVAIDVAASVID